MSETINRGDRFDLRGQNRFGFDNLRSGAGQKNASV